MNDLTTGRFVLYWMQQAQRVADNPALEYAIRMANSRGLPLVVLSVITDDYPEANLRHYSFMLQGLHETWEQLIRLNISCLIMSGEMVASVTAAANNAACLVTDMGYLNIQRQWRQDIADHLSIPVFQIETEPFMPVESVMQSEAYGALSIRTRMYRLLTDHQLTLSTAPILSCRCDADTTGLILKHCNYKTPGNLAPAYFYASEKTYDTNVLRIDRTVSPVLHLHGGYAAAKKRLTYFQDSLLGKFQVSRSDPALDVQSELSPYLHFGQISIREIMSDLLEREGLADTEFWGIVRTHKPGTHPVHRVNGLLEMFEQGIIRRELSFNFCHFNHEYDSFGCLPRWARVTLADHSLDKRAYLYGIDEFEQARTHDECWNAAQMELLLTGKMHGYMRMYWGKKILEWSASPEDALMTALYLNNKYALDGRDANAFAGVAWCFGKHDRPWAARPIYGNVRSMTQSGLKRKFAMADYIKRIKQL